jgi:DNA-binding LacI/PurR family transcriptional regulator
MQAAAYLLAKGHRKILMPLFERDDLLYQREMDGFFNYLTVFGIQPIILRNNFEYGSSQRVALESLLLNYLQKNEPDFTAFYSTGYQDAVCMYEIARNCGFSVPDDISIFVGADMPGLSEHQPKFTAITRDFDGYMKAIVKIVKKLRAGEHVGCIRVPSYVVERGSVRDISDTAEPLQIDVSSFLQDGIGRMFCFQNLLEEKKYDSKL